MKKLVSILLALCMIATLAPTFALADVAAPAETLTLIDFGNPESFDSAICEHPTAMASAVAYEGKTSSLRYVMNGYDVNIPINTTERDLAGYNTADTSINIRFYSEAVGSKFNIIYVNSDESSKYYPVPGNNNRLTITGGWQTFTVPFSSVYAQTGNKITVRLNDFGWGNTAYNKGDVVYVDSIWLDTTPEYDSMKDPESLVVWDPEKGGIDMGNNGVNLLDPYGARGIYRNFERSALTLTVFNRNMKRVEESGIRNDYYTPIFSTEGYNYVNAWVYSPEPQDSGFNIRLHSQMKSSGNTVNYVNEVKMTADEYISMLVPQVDWKGWKLISVPLPATKRDIIVLSLGISTYSEGSDKHNYPENNVPLKIGFDGVWLSKGEASPQSEWEASKSYGNVDVAPYKDSDIPIADYNNPSKTPAGLNMKLTTDNSHLYDMAMRLSWNTAPGSEFKNITLADRKSQINIYKDTKNSTEFIPVTENSYLNLWMYNPEVKYALNGTDYAEINVVICYWNKATNKNVASPVCVMANWTGWKLISIPMKICNDKYNGDFVKYGINCIYAGANLGWYNVATVRTAQERENGYVWGFANHFVSNSLDPDRRNFMDIERVWLSDGPVTQGVNIEEADNSAKICPEDAYDLATLFTTEDEFLGVNTKAVKTTGDVVSVPDVTYFDGMLVFNEGLGYGEKYSVAAEIYGADGAKYTKEFVLQSENYHVMKYETANSIAVSMHGNVPSEYSDGIMIAAVYEKGTNKMLSMTPAYVEDNMVSAEVKDFNEATQEIKFIFISSFEQLKPLVTEIIA